MAFLWEAVRMRAACAGMLVCALCGCAVTSRSHPARVPVLPPMVGHAVAADHESAIAAGMDILEAGGNAADAAVAVSFALAVVRPEDCGLGGGGFAVVCPARGQPAALDFREEAPAGADLSGYLDRAGAPIAGRSTVGAWAVGIPGQVRGASEMLERFGSGRITLAEALAPAIRLAREGFPVDRHLARAMAALADTFRRRPEYRELYGETYRTFLKPGGVPYAEGEILVRPGLAATLEDIARSGPDAFYRGTIAQAIVRETGRLGGPLSASDLAGYRVRWLDPVRGGFFGYRLFAPPPPSSGGAVLLALLRVLELSRARESRIDRTHLLAEAMKHAFADRGRLLGDASEAVSAALRTMTSHERAEEILTQIDPARVRPVPGSSGVSAGRGGTSAFCVVDGEGGVVSWTESINLGFGSLVTVPGTGIVLNNTMDDFSLAPGAVNTFGLVQGAENLLRPGARPLSSMCPVIVYGADGFRLAAGGSGGPRIITGVLHALVGTLLDGIGVEAAVRRGRFHHQWDPDVLFVEPTLAAETVRELLERGHTLRAYTGGAAGCVQAIERRNGVLYRVADPRKLAGSPPM